MQFTFPFVSVELSLIIDTREAQSQAADKLQFQLMFGEVQNPWFDIVSSLMCEMTCY